MLLWLRERQAQRRSCWPAEKAQRMEARVGETEADAAAAAGTPGPKWLSLKNTVPSRKQM